MRDSLSSSTATLPQLSELGTPQLEQLDDIKAHLDLVLLALEALTGLGSDEMLKAAADLKLDLARDRIGLWRLRQSNPLRKSTGGRKKLDVEEARGLVLVTCYLAKQHQSLIRRAVTLLEQMNAQNEPPHRIALLGDYLDNFVNAFQERMREETHPSARILMQLACKLLVDLLFYSAQGGPRRLWLALLEYTPAP
ncbi:MAG: DUF3038 domain-containing protein [Cyanobacteria bacterium P01_H01_bin.15]